MFPSHNWVCLIVVATDYGGIWKEMIDRKIDIHGLCGMQWRGMM